MTSYRIDLQMLIHAMLIVRYTRVAVTVKCREGWQLLLNAETGFMVSIGRMLLQEQPTQLIIFNYPHLFIV